MTKSDLRSAIRLRLRGIASEAAEKSRRIAEAISCSSLWVRSRSIALFSALPGEPDLAPLWQCRGSRRLCFPRTEPGRITFVEAFCAEDLVPAAWHAQIREPPGNPAHLVLPADLDILLVPGVAFTRSGHRLGRGKGLYDRYLADVSTSAIKLGVCFECQVVESIPSEPHDQLMHAIVTEAGFSNESPG